MKLSEILLSIGCVVLISSTVWIPYVISNPTEGKRILEQQGYTDVRYTGVNFWGCGEGDIKRDQFTVTNPKGSFPVTVCSGLWKGYTIRF